MRYVQPQPAVLAVRAVSPVKGTAIEHGPVVFHDDKLDMEKHIIQKRQPTDKFQNTNQVDITKLPPLPG
jgi:hypothetical protein